MKRLFIKSLCLILSLLFIFSTVTGCRKGDDETVNSTDTIEIKEVGAYEGGMHIYNKSAIADKWLVKDGRTEYKIVLPDSNHSRVALARNDFKDKFLEATGVSILATTEDKVVWDETAKYIFIGCKTIEETAGLTLNEGLPTGKTINLEGFRIRTKGESIFISSFDEEGALWGTYELLTQLFNYEIYWVDYYEIDKGVSEVPLYNFDIADNPDFETRIGPWGAVYTNSTTASRMRFILQHSDVYVGTTRFHNTLEYLPPEVNMAEYPEWYAQQVSEPVPLVNVFQLCYTAHGDPVKYEAMVNAMAEACCAELWREHENVVKGNAVYKPVITITQEDNTNYCNCNACSAGTAKYGGNISGNMWVFHLDVVRKINEWLDANIPGRRDSLLICMYAYQTYQQAPAKKGADGTWSPCAPEVDATNDPTVDNAAIFYAASTADYTRGLHREEFNSKLHTALDGWTVCCNNSGAWLYQTDFHDYLIPTDTFSYQQTYKMFLNFGSKWIFDQGQQGNENSSGFNDYKLYLNSKLQWNVNLDVNQLQQKYFNAMYGPAASVMTDYFYSIRMHMQTLKATDIDGALSSATNFPYAVVKQWLNYVDEGYKAIEGLKDTDPERYQILYDHICTEGITARYLLITYHEGSISPERLIEEKASFKEDVLRLGFTEYIQHEDINDLVKDW